MSHIAPGEGSPNGHPEKYPDPPQAPGQGSGLVEDPHEDMDPAEADTLEGTVTEVMEPGFTTPVDAAPRTGVDGRAIPNG